MSNAFNTVHRAAVLWAVRGSTAVTVTRVPCSPALAMLLYSPFAALGASSKVTPRSGPSSLCLFTRPIAEARAAPEASHPGGLDVCSIFLRWIFRGRPMLPSALTEGFRRIGLTFVGQDGGHPGVFARPVLLP